MRLRRRRRPRPAPRRHQAKFKSPRRWEKGARRGCTPPPLCSRGDRRSLPYVGVGGRAKTEPPNLPPRGRLSRSTSTALPSDPKSDSSAAVAPGGAHRASAEGARPSFGKPKSSMEAEEREEGRKVGLPRPELRRRGGGDPRELRRSPSEAPRPGQGLLQEPE